MTGLEIATKVVEERTACLFRKKRTGEGYDCKQYEGSKRGWSLLDHFSASAVCVVWHNLNEENKKKFEKLSLPKMVAVSFKLIK